VRIRCLRCQRIRVFFRENKCRRCWKQSRPSYRVVRLPNGQTRKMGTAKVAQQMGRSKGGEVVQAAGKAHRWTSTTARDAALRMWRLNPVNKRIGVRLGRPAKNRPAVDHAAIRQQYLNGSGPITFDGIRWFVRAIGTTRGISERAALIRLGYLPNPRGFVPRVVDPYLKSSSTELPGRRPKSKPLSQSLSRPTSGVIYAPVPLARRPK
jgi:hypothetical protein